MPDLHSLADRLYYTNRREYSTQEGNIAYLDGTPLRRPLSMPIGQKLFALVIVAVAIALGVLFFNNTVLATMREAEATEQAIASNLARQASIDTIPTMAELVILSDDEILQEFDDAGYTIFDASEIANSDDMVLYKLPADLSVKEAEGILAKGISGLDAPQATKFLNGSWYFDTERSGTTSMIVRYTDFSTADPATAVSNAVKKEGFDPETITDSGEDEHGNTYSTGVIELDDKSYTWKVSALPLSDMYTIKNMPEDACYVGIRITAQ